jgi:hypothetical protein
VPDCVRTDQGNLCSQAKSWEGQRETRASRGTLAPRNRDRPMTRPPTEGPISMQDRYSSFDGYLKSGHPCGDGRFRCSASYDCMIFKPNFPIPIPAFAARRQSHYEHGGKPASGPTSLSSWRFYVALDKGGHSRNQKGPLTGKGASTRPRIGPERETRTKSQYSPAPRPPVSGLLSGPHFAEAAPSLGVG